MTVDVDEWWALLVSVLESVASVSAREPEGLVVSDERGDGTRAVVEIVMSPEEWDDLVSMMWGSVRAAAEHVRDQVLSQPTDKRFLVYHLYNLVACDRPALPVSPDVARLQELAARHQGAIPGGTWHAGDPERA